MINEVIHYKEICFSYLKGREGRRKRGREEGKERESGLFNSLIHFPNGCKVRGCARLKPEARGFFQVSNVVLRPTGSGYLLLLSQVYGAGSEVEQSGLKSAPT